MKDGEHVARIGAENGEWIAVGTYYGEVYVWDTETYETVWKHRQDDYQAIHAIDFSSDSTRLIAVAENGTVIVHDITEGKEIQTHTQDHPVITARFSQQPLAMDPFDWDSNNSHLLVIIPVTVTPLVQQWPSMVQ